MSGRLSFSALTAIALASWLAVPAAAEGDGAPEPVVEAPATPGEGAPDAEPGAASEGAEAAAAVPEPDPLFDEGFDEAVDLDVAPDPLEGMNRTFFGFNQWLDGVFWEPVTDTYRLIMPEPGRRAVRRVFLNMNSAPIFVNDVLQLRFDDAGVTLGRFMLNTTVGLGGLFDAGIEAGWEFHDSDFGETLALYGVPSGPYLVIPVFGPSTVRDGVGDIVDRLFEPLTYIFGIGVLGSSIQVVVGTGTGITTYEAHVDELDALENSSIDYYAALRSVYLQNREAEIREVIEDSWLRRAPATEAQESSSEASPAASSAMRSSSASSSASKPSRAISEEFSERRSASSLTVPLR